MLHPIHRHGILRLSDQRFLKKLPRCPAITRLFSFFFFVNYRRFSFLLFPFFSLPLSLPQDIGRTNELLPFLFFFYSDELTLLSERYYFYFKRFWGYFYLRVLCFRSNWKIRKKGISSSTLIWNVCKITLVSDNFMVTTSQQVTVYTRIGK